MEPEDTEEKEKKEIGLPESIRISTTVDYIDAKIIDNLRGTFGNSRSSVISYIIKDWVKSNTDTLIKYGIDIAGMRKEIKSSKKEIKIEEEIQKHIFEGLELRFKRIKRYNIEKLAELLSVHVQTLIDFITLKGDDLEKVGLNLQIDGDYIVKE